jgi:BirA family transcriptional regulator, biotin operon repressor / biotin---[acetyl-CoA-carboxylase] ligase
MQLPSSLTAHGDQLLHLSTIDSTMEEARRLSSPDLTHRLWIVADEQTAGRGRQGRNWVSPPGNLHLTLLLPTATPLRDQPKLGFAAGVALARTAQALLPDSVPARLKWPNDLLVGGAKASGLLLEGLGQGAAVAIGMGVNILAHPPDTPYPATHLAEHAPGLERTQVFEALAEALAEELDLFADGRGFALTRRRWLSFAAHFGRRISIGQENSALEGIFADLDGDGRLLIETAQGPVRIAAGDVFPLDN